MVFYFPFLHLVLNVKSRAEVRVWGSGWGKVNNHGFQVPEPAALVQRPRGLHKVNASRKDQLPMKQSKLWFMGTHLDMLFFHIPHHQIWFSKKKYDSMIFITYCLSECEILCVKSWRFWSSWGYLPLRNIVIGVSCIPSLSSHFTLSLLLSTLL